MKQSSRASQRGFSLVELMVVVAIIGVLATIAIPNVQKYIAKARQTEAKTNLSSIYTSEKAFYAEYTAYHSAFGPIGYSPEGKLRYNVGFAAPGTPAGVANGFTAPIAGLGANIQTVAYCGMGGNVVAVSAGGSGCTVLNGADNANPPGSPSAAPATATSLTTTAFVAGASAVITTNGAIDGWTMDDSKVLKNTNDGIR